MFHPNTTVTVTWDSDGVCASWLLHGWIQIHSERVTPEGKAYIMHNVLHEEKLDENLVGSTVNKEEKLNLPNGTIMYL